MPHLLHHPSPHPARRATTAAGVLALLAAALTACTNTGTSTPQPAAAASTPRPAAAGTPGLQAAVGTVYLDGAGSTFDAPFFDLAFPAWQQANLYTGVSYAAVGSSAGIARFAAGQVNFGATDVPASTADLAGARGGPALQVPVDLGAVAVAYNVMTLTNTPLKLTGPVIAKIFLGQITKWDDPAITALNPGAALPDAYITVVHRSDGSGTTYIFSNYLSDVSPAWAAKIGTGRSLNWPVGIGGNGNAGVATDIEHIAYSIGYVERSYTTGTSLGYAAIANRDGRYTTPTLAAIAADAAAKPHIGATDFAIVNEPGPATYPICGYSWVLISARQTSQPVGQALVSLLSWLTHAGQGYAATLGYVPLPPAIQQLAATTLARVTGPDGQPLTG
jgi:phosphate transport system substrate-binding protein